jgi:DNA-binding IclR family transcriptional regulator
MSRVVPSIQKAIRILDLLADNLPRSLPLKQIASELQLPRSTALAMCVTLCEAEMITRDLSGNYRLGPHAVTLGSAYIADRNPIENLAEAVALVPELEEETVVISVLDGPNIVYVAFHIGDHSLSIRYKLGTRLPADCAAGGKSMLSLLDETEVRSRLHNVDLTVHSTGESKSLDEVLADLRVTRERGWALDNEEIVRGIVCFGAPICGLDGSPIAAVSVTAIKTALSPADWTMYPEAVIRLAQHLSVNIARRVS